MALCKTVVTFLAKFFSFKSARIFACAFQLRTFVRNFSNIDFFLKLLPLKDDELAMSEM